MSFEMTFRQKAIRVFSSAAICGLSVSFVVGETVDNKAKLLMSWTADAALLPSSYLPLRPLTAAQSQIGESTWQQNLVALNQLPTSAKMSEAAAMPPSLEVADLALPPVEVATIHSDQVKVAAAAPAQKANQQKKANADLKAEAASAQEVEKLLLTIHDATAKLAEGPTQVKPATLPKEIVSFTPKTLPAPPAASAAPALVVAKPLDKPQDEPLNKSASKNEAAFGAWTIQGSILVSTARPNENGHFEVGFFSKISPEGNPIGYPFPQQILSSGQTSFSLEVPARMQRGYLFAEFVEARTGKRTLIAPPMNPFERRPNVQVAELLYNVEDSIASVASAAATRETASDQWKLQGNVATLFSGQASIPQDEVVVKVRGRKEFARTDRQGSFSLELPRLKGSVYLEFLKAGYHPSIVNVAAGESSPLKVELASRHAIDQISQKIGSIQGSASGIFVGKLQNSDGSPLRNATAQLSLKADGPFYFDDDGVVNRDAKATGSTGKFLFLNVESGTGYLETSVNGESIAPIQVSSVEGGELVQKTLVPTGGTIKGRIFNPVEEGGKLAPISRARVRIEGGSEWVSTDSYGAFSLGPLKWFKGERVSLEVTAEKFNNHRYLMDGDRSANVNLYMFPATYISRLAESVDVDVDPYAGLVIGKVNGPSLRVDALADHSTVNNARDFYFDSKGRLRDSHEMTDPRFGTYIIFNVPKGRIILQGNDKGGVLRYSDSLFSNPSSINVQME